MIHKLEGVTQEHELFHDSKKRSTMTKDISWAPKRSLKIIYRHCIDAKYAKATDASFCYNRTFDLA